MNNRKYLDPDIGQVNFFFSIAMKRFFTENEVQLQFCIIFHTEKGLYFIVFRRINFVTLVLMTTSYNWDLGI